MQMVQITRTDVFADWLAGLRDRAGRNKIIGRITRLENGNPGDVAPVGEGVSEMRIDFGPGYRVYFVRRGRLLILLLAGGDKTTQAADIEKAKALAREQE